MKSTFLHGWLMVMSSLALLCAVPLPLAANTQLNVPLTPPALQPVEPRPTPTASADDFSDADFEQADQPELGNRTGGDSGVGLVIFLLLVVLLVLLIYYLIEHGRL